MFRMTGSVYLLSYRPWFSIGPVMVTILRLQWNQNTTKTSNKHIQDFDCLQFSLSFLTTLEVYLWCSFRAKTRVHHNNTRARDFSAQNCSTCLNTPSWEHIHALRVRITVSVHGEETLRERISAPCAKTQSSRIGFEERARNFLYALATAPHLLACRVDF